MEDICKMLSDAICDDPPFSVREGGMIREGYDEQVDKFKNALTNGKT